MSTELQIYLGAAVAGVAVVLGGWLLVAGWRHFRRYRPGEWAQDLMSRGIAVAGIAASMLLIFAAWSPGPAIAPLRRTDTTVSQPSSAMPEGERTTTVEERNPERMIGAIDSQRLPAGPFGTTPDGGGGTNPGPNPGGGGGPSPAPDPGPEPSPSPSPSPEPSPSPSPSPEPDPSPSPSENPSPEPDPCDVLPLPVCELTAN